MLNNYLKIKLVVANCWRCYVEYAVASVFAATTELFLCSVLEFKC